MSSAQQLLRQRRGRKILRDGETISYPTNSEGVFALCQQTRKALFDYIGLLMANVYTRAPIMLVRLTTPLDQLSLQRMEIDRYLI